MNYQKQLIDYKPVRDFFVGIDSDGCVFDSMEAKQKEFFIPNALKYFSLFPVSKILRETWEFINLYSVHRGGNRFISLIKVFEILSSDKRVIDSGVKLPDISALKTWVSKENKLGNDTLRKYLELNPDSDLQKILTWSEKLNEDIAVWLNKIPPFPSARKAIEYLSGKADLMVVSQTPLEAVEREWEENDIRKYVRFIAAQEHGTKTEHIALAARHKYAKTRILMIGDAKGDLDAAVNNDILFYPVIPGNEDQSWNRLLNEAFDRFISGKYSGTYQDSLVNEFLLSLPDRPLHK
jgi:phosphoglycolate phosphatase-like HAD superfamily hydrolase